MPRVVTIETSVTAASDDMTSTPTVRAHVRRRGRKTAASRAPAPMTA